MKSEDKGNSSLAIYIRISNVMLMSSYTTIMERALERSLPSQDPRFMVSPS